MIKIKEKTLWKESYYVAVVLFGALFAALSLTGLSTEKLRTGKSIAARKLTEKILINRPYSTQSS